MSFQMRFNNVIFPAKITNVEGRGFLMQEVVRQNRASSSGSFYQKKRIPERPLVVHFVLHTDGLSATRRIVDEWNSILNVPAPVPITFSDELDKTYYGIPNGEPTWNEKVNKVEGSLNLLCPDPRKYGSEKTTTVTTYAIQNAGMADTSPIFTATFTKAATEFKITHQETGKWVCVIYNFKALDVLVVDLAKRKVTINGLLKMTAYDWRSDPFNLLPGANRFVVTPSAVATTTIKFTERWL